MKYSSKIYADDKLEAIINTKERNAKLSRYYHYTRFNDVPLRAINVLNEKKKIHKKIRWKRLWKTS